ncbi:DUF5719 family protein [Nocardioides sp. GXQ0305]|uniref:DUF5719 family protein n=1 Tax=Nocardioides sp. GXQ0305 TaxID=3423912 RepID=UPI003D7E5544
MTSPTDTGRRTATPRRVSPTGVLAVVLPLLTVGALWLVQPETTQTPERPADVVPVQQADLVCPPAIEREPEVAIAPAGKLEGGSAAVDDGTGEQEDVDLSSDAVTTLSGRDGATFVRARGEVSAQLLAARFQPDGLAASECVLPRPEYRFTGVGADADHASVLQLANPDSGPAVADVTVLGRNGPVDVPELRGLTVQGGRTVEVDLTQAAPTREELALDVVVSRGRLGVTLADSTPPLGTRRLTRDWLPASGEPATEQLLLGLVEGEGRDWLSLANPGEDEVRVEVRIVTEDASFVPEGLDEVSVAPGSLEQVPITAELRAEVQDGALGLELRSTGPVTAGLASVVEGDRVLAPVVSRVGSPITSLVPPGRSSLVLAGAERAGVAVVEAYDDGKRLSQKRVELTEGSGGRVELPEDASLVRVTPRRTSVAASLVSTGDGATVLPLQELVRTTLVPDVRPGLP